MIVLDGIANLGTLYNICVYDLIYVLQYSYFRWCFFFYVVV